MEVAKADALDNDAENPAHCKRTGHGQGNGGNKLRDHKASKSPDHKNFGVREIDAVQDTNDECKAHGDQGVEPPSSGR